VNGECWHAKLCLIYRVTARGIFRSTREDLLLRSGNLIKDHAQGKQVIKYERAINQRSNEYTHMLILIVKLLPWVNITSTSLCFQLVLL